MDLPRCGVSLCFFGPNPVLSAVNDTSILLIYWVVSWGQSWNKISHGRRTGDEAVPPLEALPKKNVPHPNYQGPR